MTPLRAAAVWLLAIAAALISAAPAAAHPLGNFSVNHLTEVTVSADRVGLLYILDQAEIPTFQERGTPPEEVLARKRAEVLRRLELRVDGRRVELRAEPGASISFPPGQGGLPVTRVTLPLSAAVRMPARIELRDETFPDRVGWKAVVAHPGEGTDVRSSAASEDVTNRLRSYPEDLLRSPLDQRSATFEATEGTGALTAPRTPGGAATTTDRGAGGFGGLFEDAAAGQGVLIVLLLAAFGWGAVHALSPGHGKAMVAAYLVGSRGTARDAVALGLVVTVTHTVGVFALGLVTLLLSAHVLPEDLYPWLNLVAGVLVLVVGASVLRSRIRWGREQRAHHHPHPHPHGHGHGHDDHHEHPQAHHHEHPHTHQHEHGHPHTHELPDRITGRTLIAAGAAAGLIPCPSALVVLLAAVSQHQVALGLLLIVAFSLGLAATLTGLGLAVVSAGRFTARIDVTGRFVAALPAASAVLICGVGCLLTLQALGQF
jgi:ABC-type nickel/cobalt efflux system permease component RcnA